MTQVKLWQIVGQTPNTIVFADADGNLTTIPAGTPDQVLVIAGDGTPTWVANTALAKALEAKTDATNAVATANAYTTAQIAALVDNAPVALNTLNELAARLNNEESAINALLLQMDSKAAKTEVTAQVAQAKQEAISDSNAYADGIVSAILPDITSQIATAKSDALSGAAQDATFKANSAQANAIASANGFTTQAVAQALTTASDDATAKSAAAKTTAVSEANTYTDNALATGLSDLSTDAQSQANAARDAAIDAAALDATTKVTELRESIPGAYNVEGTSIACFVASSAGIDGRDAGMDLIVGEFFTEVTGADVVGDDPSLNAKLLFVNGMAMSDGWEATRIEDNQLTISFTPQLAAKVFDGSENALMILAEYKSYSPITLRA